LGYLAGYVEGYVESEEHYKVDEVVGYLVEARELDKVVDEIGRV